MKRVFLLIAMLLIALTISACGEDNRVSIFSRPVVERPAEGRKDWNDVSSFICYYGDFNYEVQSKFDVVIMHTSTLHSPSNPSVDFDAEAYEEEAKRGEIVEIETPYNAEDLRYLKFPPCKIKSE